MRCLICGNELKGYVCPRCGLDVSLCAERYPTLAPLAKGQASIHVTQDKLYRELLDLRAKRVLDTAALGSALRELEELKAKAGQSPRTTQATPARTPQTAPSRTGPTGIKAVDNANAAVMDANEAMAALEAVLQEHERSRARSGQQAGTSQPAPARTSQTGPVRAAQPAPTRTHQPASRAPSFSYLTGEVSITPGSQGSQSSQSSQGPKLQIKRVPLAAGDYHTVGILPSGKAVACGTNTSGQCNVEGWENLAAVAAGFTHTVGLRKDGTVAATGSNHDGRCDVQAWRNIVAVGAGMYYSAGLRSDGTVVVAGNTNLDVSGWRNIVAIAAGGRHLVGLRKDGTVVATGGSGAFPEECAVSKWQNVRAIAAGQVHTVALTRDGNLLTCGSNRQGQRQIAGWTGVASLTAGGNLTLGQSFDGSVRLAGTVSGMTSYTLAQTVKGWTNIVLFSCGATHVVGLRKDGTVAVAYGTDQARGPIYNWRLMSL